MLYPIFMSIALIRYGLFDMQQIADAFQREKMAVLGTMAASLNHELRTPLYLAKGHIEAYLDSVQRGRFVAPGDRQQKSDEVLTTSHRQLQRAADIMQRFSDFARPFPEKGVSERLELRVLVHEVSQLISNELETKKITMDTASLDDKAVQANRRQMEEILLNLMMNACHAMEARGGVLKIAAYEQKGRVLMAIQDHGAGIPANELDEIFLPFHTTKEQGTGLGLYITKQLIESNGGKISVTSKVGEGTTFTLAFRAATVGGQFE